MDWYTPLSHADPHEVERQALVCFVREHPPRGQVLRTTYNNGGTVVTADRAGHRLHFSGAACAGFADTRSGFRARPGQRWARLPREVWRLVLACLAPDERREAETHWEVAWDSGTAYFPFRGCVVPRPGATAGTYSCVTLCHGQAELHLAQRPDLALLWRAAPDADTKGEDAAAAAGTRKRARV